MLSITGPRAVISIFEVVYLMAHRKLHLVHSFFFHSQMIQVDTEMVFLYRDHG